MAQATHQIITSPEIPLSQLFTDPRLRYAFWRAEREQGGSAAASTDRPRVLQGGAAARALEAV